jgi:hypothetical protein
VEAAAVDWCRLFARLAPEKLQGEADILAGGHLQVATDASAGAPRIAALHRIDTQNTR